MLTSKRFLLTVALLVAAIVAAGYLYGRADELEAELAAARSTARADSLLTASYVRLVTTDSLLYAGDYRSAIEDYRSLAEDTSYVLPAAVLTTRIDHARRLIQIGGRLDTLQLLASRRNERETDSLAAPAPLAVERMPLETSRPNQYDSLTFALQKAEMRIRNLQSRLKGSSEGNYLTFESRQGNTIYYVGDVRNGKANGRGVALLSSGSRYEGNWKDNRKHGVGEFFWPDGARYEGEYEDDQRSGRGTYHFPGGGVFVGAWDNDLRNGTGVFYDEHGEVVTKGEWEDDELVAEE